MSTQDQYERFLRFLEVDPYNVQLLANTANLASELGHYGQAIELADRGLTLEPKHQVLLSTKALACLSSGDVDSALTQFQQLLDDGQHEPIVRYNLAYCLMLKEQDEQALTLLDDALEQYGELPQMVTLKMRAIYTMGELDKAIELGKQALAANPDDGSVHEIMSSLYFDSSDFVSAQQAAGYAARVDGAHRQRLEFEEVAEGIALGWRGVDVEHQVLDAHAPLPRAVHAGLDRRDHAGLHAHVRVGHGAADALRALVHVEEVAHAVARAVAEVDALGPQRRARDGVEHGAGRAARESRA